MRQQTLQEQYNLIVEGKGNVNAFHRQALKQFPHLFTAQSSFDQVVTVLKQKSIISEMVAQGLVSNSSQPNFFEIFNTNIAKLNEEVKAEEKKTSKEVEEDQSHNYDYKNKKSIDNHSGAEFLLGFYVESRNAKNVDKTVEQIKDIVVKNLIKNPLHYVESGQFGVEGLGYTEEAPGLGKTKEVTGKYKSSGMEPVKLKESKQLKEGVDVYTINPAALIQSLETNTNFANSVKKEASNDIAKKNIIINKLKQYAKDNKNDSEIQDKVNKAVKEFNDVSPMYESKETLIKEILKKIIRK